MEDLPTWLERARGGWSNRGAVRPEFASAPEPGQESVWEYPRPPIIVDDPRRVVVGDPADPLAVTSSCLRVLETASPPTFYLPASDVRTDRLVAVDGSSFCEWKGRARFWALRDDPAQAVGWSYPDPLPGFEPIAARLAFYPGRIRCAVDGQVVRPQAGGFYGGWITDEIIGPFKGEPGTGGW